MDVAAVHITELYTDCVIGELDGDPEIWTSVQPPKTKSPRQHYRIEKGKLTPREMVELAAKWIAANSVDLKFVVACCCGPFVSLDNEDLETGKVYRNDGAYGRLGRLSRYDDNWSDLQIYDLLKGGFAGLNPCPSIRIYTDVDAGAYGEFWYRSDATRLSRPYLKSNPSRISHPFRLPSDSGDESTIETYKRRGVVVFLSFGRSINGGITSKGEVFRGRQPPLMSSIRPARYTISTKSGDVLYDDYPGCCPYHGSCIEGLIGINALEDRTGMPFSDIPQDNPVWHLVAYYAAALCVSVTGTLSPSRIILSGRVIKYETDRQFSKWLLAKIRGHFYAHVNPKNDEVFSPNYKAITRKGTFLSLPKQAVKRDKTARQGKPIIHGALKIASTHVYESMK